MRGRLVHLCRVESLVKVRDLLVPGDTGVYYHTAGEFKPPCLVFWDKPRLGSTALRIANCRFLA